MQQFKEQLIKKKKIFQERNIIKSFCWMAEFQLNCNTRSLEVKSER